MDLSAGFNAYFLNQETFDVCMNIFFGGIQMKLSFSMEGFHRLQALKDLSPILFGKDALPAEHEDMGPASPEIIGDQSFVNRRLSFNISPGKKIHNRPGKASL